MFNKETVRDIVVTNKTVLVRTMLNVPIKDNQVTDKTRLVAAKETINYLLEHQAALILISHHSDEKQSLVPVAPVLAELLGRPVKFVNSCLGPDVEAAVQGLQPGEVLMLENLRFQPEEKANDPRFAKTLAGYGQVFVEDDFTACHREHASLVGIPKYLEAVAGLALEREVLTITKILENPKRPVVAVLGGAKISTKIPILSFLIDRVDAVFVGGAMANTFLLARDMNVGRSLVEPEQLELAKQILAKAADQGKQFLLPLDVVATSDLDKSDNIRTIMVTEVGDGDIIADVGPKTVAQLNGVIDPAGSVIWNGPVGIFETPAFANGTKAVADAIIASTAYSLVGGGDTLNYIDNARLHDKFSFVSLGGGASMDLLSGKLLPGVEALRDKK
jgi:phosphoglycerate kinase